MHRNSNAVCNATRHWRSLALVFACSATFALSAAGQGLLMPDTSPDRVQTPLAVPFKYLGTIRPRAASEIKASNWTVGCEGLDRDFDDFSKYRHCIEPLGIKTIRVQAGWAKTEKVPGVLDFAWLDEIVDYAVGHGINVLLETGYGNPAYEGGGGMYLGAAFPTNEVALAAWDRWVDALSKRYKGKVRDWAMWNEPDISQQWQRVGPPVKGERKSPAEIAAQNVRTARIIKRNIPDARIGALSLAQNKAEFLEECLKAMGDDVKLFTWVIYHGYCPNPDLSYAEVEKQKEVVKRYNPDCKLRQGENGCPSGWVPNTALSKWPWSEYSQAKWDMRRMLGDLGHDVESSVFTLMGGGENKSLTRRAKDRTVIDYKLAYYAVQNVASVFDCTLARRTNSLAITTGDETIALYEYRKRGKDQRPVYVFWDHGDLTKYNRKTNPQCPSDSFLTRPVAFVVRRALKEPVWVDMLTGRVYEFPRKCIIPTGTGATCIYKMVPVYDSPCLLTERSVVLGPSAVNQR